MPPPKRNWEGKRGYIINAMKKRKLAGEKRKAEDTVGERPPVKVAADTDVEDDPSPAVSDIDSPSYSPNASPDNSAEMDTSDINVNSPLGDPGTLGDGSYDGGARNARSATLARSGMSASSGGGLRGQAILPRGIRQDSMREVRRYRKQYLFRVQNEAVEISHKYDASILQATDSQITRSNPTRSGSVGIIRYPYHDLPVNMLAFYLTSAEMHALSYFSECRVISAKCDVYNKTGVLNFETAASNASIGNNNVGIYLNQISSDIGNKRVGRLPDLIPLIEERIWGETYKVQKQASDFSQTNVALLGARYVRRTLSNKFEYYTPMNQTLSYDYTKDTYVTNGKNVNNDVPGVVPYFNINPFIEKRVNASMQEGLFTQWSYKPKDGLVAGNFSVGPNNIMAIAKFNSKSRLPMIQKSVVSEASGTATEPQPLTNMAGQDFQREADTDSYIPGQVAYTRSANITTQIDRVETTGSQIPPLIIGIEPLVSEIPTNTSNKWETVKCFVDLYVDVELEMECKYGFDYIDPSIPSIPANYMFPELMVRGPNETIYIPNAEYRDINCKNIAVQQVSRNERQNIPEFSNGDHPLKKSRTKRNDFAAYSVPLTRRQSKLQAEQAKQTASLPRTGTPPQTQQANQVDPQQQQVYDYKTGRYYTPKR